METTRRGFFGAVTFAGAGALHSVPERVLPEPAIPGFFDINRVDPVVGDRLIREGWLPINGDPMRAVVVKKAE